MHEFTHILGFSGKFIQTFFPQYIFIKDDENGFSRRFLNSTKLIHTAKKYFNCDEIDGIPLEEGGGNGTISSHWEEKIFLGELMCGAIYPPEQSFSEFTLSLLEDLGYYKVNYYTGGLMKYGKNKGCEFLYSKCVNNGKVNPKFKNEFFDNIRNEKYDAGCSSGRESRVYHYLKSYNNSIPTEYQYFNSSSLGGRELKIIVQFLWMIKMNQKKIIILDIAQKLEVENMDFILKTRILIEIIKILKMEI